MLCYKQKRLVVVEACQGKVAVRGDTSSSVETVRQTQTASTLVTHVAMDSLRAAQKY